MAFTDKATLKNDFRTGAIPTGQKFANLIDSTVSTVNGQQPDANGNVNVAASGEVVIEPPIPNSFYYHPAESEGQLQTVTLRVTDYNPDTDALDYYVGGFHMPPRDVRVDSYENDMMTITILEEGRYIQYGRRLEVIKWRFGSTPRLDATVVDSLDSQSRTDAVSAYQANFLKNTLSNVISGVNQHAATKASATTEGHVKVDGTTIVSNNGVISAVGGGGGDGQALIEHEAKVATNTELGHVKVDGTTITINDGVISAVGSQQELPVASTTQAGIVQLSNQYGTNTNFAPTLGLFSGHSNASGTKASKGHVTVGQNIDVTSAGLISIKNASSTNKGVVQVDGTTIIADANGVISAVGGGGSTEKKLIQVGTTGNNTHTISEDKIVRFNSVKWAENLSYSTETGFFTVQYDKFYRVTLDVYCTITKTATGASDPFIFIEFVNSEGFSFSHDLVLAWDQSGTGSRSGSLNFLFRADQTQSIGLAITNSITTATVNFTGGRNLITLEEL